MNRFLTLWMALSCAVATAQADGPWKLRLADPAEEVTLCMDLYEESIEVPTMEMFGPMNGYLCGNVYCVWAITSFTIKDDKRATLRLSNELGSETQQASLTHDTDTTWTLRLEGPQVMKRAVGRKLVKMPSVLHMRKL